MTVWVLLLTKDTTKEVGGAVKSFAHTTLSTTFHMAVSVFFVYLCGILLFSEGLAPMHVMAHMRSEVVSRHLFHHRCLGLHGRGHLKAPGL